MAIPREDILKMKAFLEEAGATDIAFLTKKRRVHPRLVFTLHGVRYQRIIGSTVSDYRYMGNVLADLKRIVRRAERKP